MPLLFWDRPEKKMSVEEWKKISFDGGPPGGYVPNISNKDVHKWRAKIIGKSTKHPTIEVRHQTKRGSQITIIVSPGNGYKYKFYKPERTKGINIHIATNGPIQFSFEEFEEFSKVIKEAKHFLKIVEKERNSK